MTIKQFHSHLREQRIELASIEAKELILAEDKAAEMDAGFDAGEFSGPSHDMALKDGLEAIAEKYNITITELENTIHAEIMEIYASQRKVTR